MSAMEGGGGWCGLCSRCLVLTCGYSVDFVIGGPGWERMGQEVRRQEKRDNAVQEMGWTLNVN